MSRARTRTSVGATTALPAFAWLLATVCVACQSGAASTPKNSTTVSSTISSATTATTAPSSSSTTVDTSTASTPDVPSPPLEPDSIERAAPCASADETVAFGALDLHSGSIAWRVCSAAKSYRAAVGASEDVLVVWESKERGGVDTVALSTTDGRELWRRSTAPSSSFAGDLAGGSVVPVLTDEEGDPFVIGIELASGAEAWRLAPGTLVLAVDNGVVVVATGAQGSMVGGDPSATPAVQGIDRATGAVVWTTSLRVDDQSGVGVQRGAAAVTDGVLAVPTGAAVTGIDLASGDVLWTSDQLDHPTGADGVFVGTPGNQRGLRAIDARRGATLWESDTVAVSYGDLLAVGGGVLVAQDNTTTSQSTVGIDLRSGDERWRTPVAVHGDPQLTAGDLAVLLWEGTLGVIATDDGTVAWAGTEPFNSSFMSGATANSATLFVSINSLPWGD